MATSATTKATTGAGFTPTGLMQVNFGGVASTSVQQRCAMSIGATSGTALANNFDVLFADKDAQATTETSISVDGEASVEAGNEESTALTSGILSAFGSDGFTINYAAGANGTAFQFIYLLVG
jgi:hypothetical protein